jgi:hypothetical protein
MASLLAPAVLSGDSPSAGAVAPGWTVEPVASGFEADMLDLEQDSSGTEHLVYYDGSTNEIEYRRRTAPGVWEDGLFPYQGSLPQLDFDPVDAKAYVLFVENVTGNLKLAWRGAGGAWTSDTAMSTGGMAHRLSFEMLDGTAHIALTNAACEVMYRHFDMDGFSYTIPLDGCVGPDIADPSLALRSDGLPRITYNLDGELYYALTPDTFDWGAQLVDNSSANVGKWSSLALAADGTPHVSYQNTTEGALEYASKNFFQWFHVPVDGETEAVGLRTSLALDPLSGRPRIAHEGAVCKVCFAARQPGGSWTKTVVVDTPVPTHARKLILAANGEARIAYGTDEGIYVAFQSLVIFVDGFEAGNTGRWSTTSF